MDTLAGIFGIGQHPKGDKDPFALRRAALGVLRIIVEKNLPLDLQTLTEEAVRLYGSKLSNARVVDDVIDFTPGRFRACIRKRVTASTRCRRFWRVVRPVRLTLMHA